MRTTIALNNDWLYLPQHVPGDTAVAHDESGFTSVRLPHTNFELPLANFDEADCQFVSCYRRRVFIAATERGRRTFLHFEAVMVAAQVWCNGTLVGEHIGGYTPFTVEITDQVRHGEENLIAVVVDSTERDDVPPFGNVVDFLTFGGIYREVQLIHTDPVRIENLKVVGTWQPDGRHLIEVDLHLDPGSEPIGELSVELELADPTKVLASHRLQVTVPGSGAQVVTADFHADKLRTWTLDDPALYTLTARLVRAGEVGDELSVRTGFRDAHFESDGLHLNGELVKIRGLNRHQSYPYVGYAMPANAQARDADILKYELGVNLVRTSHYPQSRHFLDRCDEIGLLVFSEIPGWQHIGGTQWRANALASVAEMVERDWNRPSVIIWGVRINESPDHDELYRATNELARQLDSTRPTGGVRNTEHGSVFEDVYTYNDFVHNGRNAGLLPPSKVRPAGMPYLDTEHTGHMFPTKKYDNEERRIEQAMRHLRVLDAMYADKEIGGAIGWCMFDYHTHSDFGSGDKICHHGVLDPFRIPKLAAAAYASQADEPPVLVVGSAMNRGDLDEARIQQVPVFTNADEIRLSKNGEFIGSYFPDRKQFGHLPHPPVVITDLVGDQLVDKEGYSLADADRIKAVFADILTYGDKALPTSARLRAGSTLARLRMSQARLRELFLRYVSDWGGEASIFTFEAVKDGQIVASHTQGPVASAGMRIQADSTELVEGDTWDATRVVARHVDTLGNDLSYSFEPIQIQVSGAAELIGPELVTLSAGSTGFWVRSVRPGSAVVRVQSHRLGVQELELTVR